MTNNPLVNTLSPVGPYFLRAIATAGEEKAIDWGAKKSESIKIIGPSNFMQVIK